MTSSFLGLLGLLLAAITHAQVHHIVVGNFGEDYNVTEMVDGTQDVGAGFLYTLRLDANAGTLELVGTTEAQSAHPWLSYNNETQTVYASGWSRPRNGTRTYSSYRVPSEANYTLAHINTVSSCGTKPIANEFVPSFGAHGVFYGLDFVNPCGDVWSVTEDGGFGERIQGLEYGEGSTLHGFAITPDEQFLYTMDLGGNSIHAYTTAPANGTLAPLQDISPAQEGAGARHAVITPSAEYLYLIEETALVVEQFALDPQTGLLNATGVRLPVTPFGLQPENATAYWGDELVLSASGSTLFASTRARNASFPGFIAGWALASDGSLLSSSSNDTAEYDFLIETPEAGGTSNILSTSPEEDGLLILTDQDTGFVALYNLTQEKELVLLDRVNITETNCCSGSVWLD